MKNSLNIFFSLCFLLGSFFAFAQVAPDCVDAIPICNNTPVNGGTNGIGVDDFNGEGASGCLRRALSGSVESNSAWYRFKTGASGQLGFNIGFDISEDWDFALYKSNDCDNLGEPVRCNFFDNTQDPKTFAGVGQDPTGSPDNFQYEDWLQVTPGEEYYLLINNFSNTNSGFSIQFSGNIFVTHPNIALDCSIIEELLGPPVSACEGEQVTLNAETADATDYTWFRDAGSGFQEIMGEVAPTLTVIDSGRYQVEIITNLNNAIISEVQVAFSPVPIANPIINDASCSGLDVYDLSQKDAEALGTQDSNMFVVSYYLSLGDANNGTNVLSKQYETQPGSQTIFVRISSISNPDCFDVSEWFELINLQTPVLDFPSEAFLCEDGGSTFIGAQNAIPNHSYSWDSGQTTAGITVNAPGTYTVRAINSQNGISCENSKTVTVVESKAPQILDIIVEGLQTNNTVTVEASTDSEWEYQLNDGDYQSENTFFNVAPGMNTITVNDSKGCGQVSEEIIVIGFPKYFSPNLDGSNDDWHIVGVNTLQNAKIYIYDRYGKLLKYLGENDTQGWDGTSNGQQMPASDYWFKLTYEDVHGEVRTAKYVNNHFSLKR